LDSINEEDEELGSLGRDQGGQLQLDRYIEVLQIKRKNGLGQETTRPPDFNTSSPMDATFAEKNLICAKDSGSSANHS